MIVLIVKKEHAIMAQDWLFSKDYYWKNIDMYNEQLIERDISGINMSEKQLWQCNISYYKKNYPDAKYISFENILRNEKLKKLK